jgi:hypothetical protein
LWLVCPCYRDAPSLERVHADLAPAGTTTGMIEAANLAGLSLLAFAHASRDGARKLHG